MFCHLQPKEVLTEMTGLPVLASLPWCPANVVYSGTWTMFLSPKLLLPTPTHIAITYLCFVLANCQRTISTPLSVTNTHRLDLFPWHLPKVCTCHFLLALLNASCLTMWLSICYWSLELLLPLLTCLCRLPPTIRRAIHLPNADSQLPPWMFCSIRPRFLCSHSPGLSSHIELSRGS